MPVAAPTTTPDAQIEKARARHLREAQNLEDDIYAAIDVLTASGALPRDHWRFLAHVCFCRAVYETHIRPLEDKLTFAEIANHLNEIRLPRFRGMTPWSAPAISDIRAVVANPDNQIMLPDP